MEKLLFVDTPFDRAVDRFHFTGSSVLVYIFDVGKSRAALPDVSEPVTFSLGLKPGGRVADIKGIWRKVKMPAGLRHWRL